VDYCVAILFNLTCKNPKNKVSWFLVLVARSHH
jgi:hypothetical protein